VLQAKNQSRDKLEEGSWMMGVAQKSWVTSKNQSHDLSLKKEG